MNRSVTTWLLLLCWLIGAMVVFGGWVRLTRSGLSMVEWHVVADAVPPLGQAAWEETFRQYQQTPEYQQINAGMTLDEYRAIYYREWGHRLLGRVIGLVFALPLVYFLWRGDLDRRHLPTLVGIGLLFASQALVGRFMVASGLVDQPHVSHYWLTFHLLCALLLLACCLWLRFGGEHLVSRETAPPPLRRLSLWLLGAVVLQISLGGLMAGLKAGYLSATFPLMFDALIPRGIWAPDLGLGNPLENPVTVHFQHRWFAFAVLGLALVLWRQRQLCGPRFQAALRTLLVLLALQVALGIAVLLTHMALSAALLHQALGLGVFAASLRVCYRAYRG
ncbi:MAG: COX15/CtaA family protein [Candidatus Latescibacteria bacterium]|nr:COX15/CtaA family protein [Candidatus Latescibacterota bacterium]